MKVSLRRNVGVSPLIEVSRLAFGSYRLFKHNRAAVKDL
jgi:hypothetical protein